MRFETFVLIDVRKADILAILDTVKAKGKLRTANMLLAGLMPMFRFDTKGVLAGFNFASMNEAKIDPLFDAWMVLPNSQRNVVEVEFRGIFELGLLIPQRS